ncbi:bifunctional lysylphosphatidylglycerol flippase/synthetase MprF [Mesorhizobium sp. RP14(2022)]|uniref:Phosphatidylglycerol lysyltransferase n=1 Tax=Mesorhizobium liriopis TaxID=2953882 RepID=A0ABT1C0L6_9HYPH|nr:bifunctional lysylphosphatidylglycerol flippase/synthetase MprF [Mesorhizobium liriopis]MCO6048178.1 bifunctional lysylphosphatidylglycerol flippase/synthetase MprF [Mesorhizobium liriopis]
MSASAENAPSEMAEVESGMIGRLWARVGHIALPLAGLVIAAIAIGVLDRFLKDVTYDQVREAIIRLPASDLLLAFCFTLLSFAAVAVYDLVAVETVAPKRVSKVLSASVGAAGYAISNALGFAILTGGALRYRVYANEGIDLPDVGRIIGTSWLAIWFAFAVLIGAGLVIDPADAPLFDRLPPSVDVAIGIAILATVALFLVWLRGGERVAGWGKFSLRLPSSRGAALQLLAGVVDMAAAASVLYVLLPDSVQIGPALFMLVYTVAIIVGIASHAPGGLGAFEATLVGSLGLGNNPEALAALLVYRLIYTILPFVIATLGVLAFEVAGHRSHVSKRVKSIARVIEPLVPPLSAGLTFLGGAVLMISGVTPGHEARLDTLSDFVPLPFVELSHLAASVVAVAMLVVARGLARRLETAWWVALGLFGLGALFSLLKGLDWEEAVILGLSSAVLIAFRTSFYRRPTRGWGGGVSSLSIGWLVGLSSIVLLSVWLGFVAYRDVDYSNQLWWEFAFEADAPRFLRFALVALLLTVGLALNTLIHRWGPVQPENAPIPNAVPAIVANAPQTEAALAFLGDKQFLLSPDKRGFVMYARSGGSLIAMGEPIGPADVVRDLGWAFRDLADRQAARTVFYEVGPESLPLFLDMGLVALKLGEVARVDLTNFTLEGPRRQPFRYAARKTEKDGVTFEVVPAAAIEAILPELRAVSDAWLDLKQGREKGFSLGFFDEEFMRHFDTAVMKQNGRIVAFANLWRGANKHELSVDLMRHAPDAPKIIMDALFARLMMYGHEEGYRWFNLGAAPLSGLVDNRLASCWNRFGAFLYRRGQNLYRFDGLKAFKEKFDPVWTPHYLVCPPGLDTVRSLIDVTQLISGSPLEFIRK